MIILSVNMLVIHVVSESDFAHASAGLMSGDKKMVTLVRIKVSSSSHFSLIRGNNGIYFYAV